MTHSTKPISPLRQRMIDDMTLRKLNPKTQSAYLRSVEKLTRFLGQPPDTASAEDLRRFQLHLVEDGVSSVTLNATITGLRFFFEVTLDRAEAMKKMSHVYQPRKIPEILSVDEVTRLLQSAGCLKYKAALGVAYGAGLRASEVCHLTTPDIDSKRMVLRVEQGKGKRDRYAILSPVLLELLRAWWREGRAKLRPLPPTRFETDYHQTRKVAWDGYIEVRGNRYSVPGDQAGKVVQIRLSLDGGLGVYADERCIARHRLRDAGDGWASVPEHHRDLWQRLSVEQRDLAIYEEVA